MKNPKKTSNKGRILLATGLIIASGITAAYAFGGPRHDRGMGFRGGFAGHAGHFFARADANGDGEISRDEVREMREKRFANFDTNDDGVVDKAEIEARIAKRIARMSTRLTRRFDTNRDGTITKAEFNARALERFSWNDLNDDGKITRDELPGRRHRGSHHKR